MSKLTHEHLLALAGLPTPAIEAEIHNKIVECINLLESKLSASLPSITRQPYKPIIRPEVTYDLKGRTAGQAFYHKNTIRLNLQLYHQNRDDMLHNTLPHELAHIVAYQWFGKSIKPHGNEWAFVMRVLGLEPTRCHQYDTTDTVARKVARPFVYTCLCSIEHKLTRNMHAKIQRGKKYQCTRCKAALKLQTQKEV